MNTEEFRWHVLRKLDLLIFIGGRTLAQQDDLNAVVTQLQNDSDGLASAQQRILDEIAALGNQNPALDLSGLQAAAADLEPHVNAIENIAPPPPASPPFATPSDTNPPPQ